MFRKLFRSGLLVVLLAPFAAAQFTLVSGTVTDPNGTPYALGTITAQLITAGVSPTINGNSFAMTASSGLSSAGSFTMQLVSNALMSPNTLQWSFTVCSAVGTVQPAGGTGPQCFTLPITISGATQSISATLSAAAPALSKVSAVGGAGNIVIYATSPAYGLKNDTRAIQDATITSGSNAISCPNSDCNFVAAQDNGKICFGTNMTVGGGSNFTTAIVVLPQGTLTVTGAQSATCNGGNATGNGVMFAWGHDDSAALAAAFAATVAACGTLQLPGVNTYGTGPAIMLTQQAQFGFTGLAGGTTANCGLGTGASSVGLSIHGVDANSTFIMPTANFVGSTCTFGTTHQACFFGTQDGLNVQNMTIWGLGNSSPGAGLTGKVVADFAATNWSYTNHVRLIGWGANCTLGFGTGAYFSALSSVNDSFFLDGVGCLGINATASAQSKVVFNMAVVFDNGDANMAVQSTPDASVSSTMGYYGDAQHANSNCSIIIQSSSYFNSMLDAIGGDLPNSTIGGLCAATGAFVTAYGDTISNTTTSSIGIKTTGTGVIYMQNTTISMLGATSTAISNAGTIFDQGGNQILNAPATIYSGAGKYISYHSIIGACTGVGTAASTLGLYGTGANVVATTCSSVLIGTGIVMQAPGTLSILTATATAAGTNGSSGVLTVLKNGAGTTLTCTFGTTTACVDGTHSVAYVAGDLISLQFTTQAAETLAGVKASVVF